MPQVAMTLSVRTADVLGDDAHAGDGIHPAARERRGHHREVGRGDRHRALPAVRRDGLLDVAAQRAGARHQVRQRAVAAGRRELGAEHVVVHAERAAGERRQAPEDPLEALGSRPPRSTSEVVSSAPALISGLAGRPESGSQADRVERLAARLRADARQDLVGADVAERERVDERLGDRLDRERDVAVAGAVDVPVHADERDAETVGIGVGELRDVRRELAVGARGDRRRGRPAVPR